MRWKAKLRKRNKDGRIMTGLNYLRGFINAPGRIFFLNPFSHNFEVSSDRKFIDDMKKKNEQAVEDGLRRIRAPGTSITETKKEV